MKPIMIVDDSPTMLASIACILQGYGMVVQQASSGPKALDLLKSGPAPRVMITDFHMPGMNGAELIKETRKLPGCRFMPILVLTTESAQGKRDLARSAGATGWIVKPVAPEKLIQVLQQVAPA